MATDSKYSGDDTKALSRENNHAKYTGFRIRPIPWNQVLQQFLKKTFSERFTFWPKTNWVEYAVQFAGFSIYRIPLNAKI